MNSQDLSNLQEAYLNVYQELDEELTGDRKKRALEIIGKSKYLGPNETQLSRMISSIEGSDSNLKMRRTRGMPTKRGGGGMRGERKTGKGSAWNADRGEGNKANRRAAELNKEDLDLYDIILSHLLDEGYADTPEAAEVIMVSMSEEWRESIVEESYISEMRKEDKVAGKKKTPLYIPGKRKSILPAEPGSGRKWKMSEPETVENPEASFGRFKQGKSLAGKVMGYKPHPHGEGGRSRGVKQIKGDISRVVNNPGPDVIAHVTPKQKVERKRASADRGDYINRYF